LQKTAATAAVFFMEALQKFKSSKVQKFKSSKVQKFKSSKVQKFKSSKWLLKINSKGRNKKK